MAFHVGTTTPADGMDDTRRGGHRRFSVATCASGICQRKSVQFLSLRAHSSCCRRLHDTQLSRYSRILIKVLATLDTQLSRREAHYVTYLLRLGTQLDRYKMHLSDLARTRGPWRRFYTDMRWPRLCKYSTFRHTTTEPFWLDVRERSMPRWTDTRHSLC